MSSFHTVYNTNQSHICLFSDEDERKIEFLSNASFNAMLSSHMEVEEGNVEPKGFSSKTKLLVGGIIFVILIIIIIVLMLPKTIKQNDCKYILSTSVPKVAFLQEVFSLSMPSVLDEFR